jgi:hypothetical protein
MKKKSFTLQLALNFESDYLTEGISAGSRYPARADNPSLTKTFRFVNKSRKKTKASNAVLEAEETK